MVRWAIFAHQPRAVDGEQYIEVLKRDVMNQLIVCALQEGRVNSDDRLYLFTGHTRCQRHSVLLSNSDIEVAVRKFLRKTNQV